MRTFLPLLNLKSLAQAEITSPLSNHLPEILTTTRLSAIGSMAGIAMSILFNQSLFATIPLSLHILAISETHRRQIGKLHRSEKQQHLAAQLVQQQIDELCGRLKTLDRRVSQLTLVPSLNSPTPKTAKEPQRPSTDRVAIFIDEANLYHAALNRGIKIDYAKLFSLLKSYTKDCRAPIYIATDSTNQGQKMFLKALERQGYEVITQEIVKRSDGSVKGNVDLRLGSELLVKHAGDYDTAVLVSGDADFVPAIEQSHRQGKRVEVASFRSNTGTALIKASDCYLNLETVVNQICFNS
jgi:uncharacterized LabA/DUF88 family protein